MIMGTGPGHRGNLSGDGGLVEGRKEQAILGWEACFPL